MVDDYLNRIPDFIHEFGEFIDCSCGRGDLMYTEQIGGEFLIYCSRCGKDHLEGNGPYDIRYASGDFSHYCGSQLVYHDNQNRWVCPHCDL